MTKDNRRSASPVQAGIDPLVAETNLRERLGGVSSPIMRGDNISIVLAGYFEPGIEDDELDDSGTWKQGAIDAANEILSAIHEHYIPLLRSQAERIAEANERCAAAIDDYDEAIKGNRYAQLERQAIKRAEAAESLLAEAREALETVRPFFDGACRDAPNAVDCLTAIDATLSRLKPGEKGGE